jgi:NAD+ diphosphatase
MKYCPECGGPLRDREVGGVVRRMCMSPHCRFVHWDNPVPVVAALVERDGEIVFARNAAWPEGVFSVITGYLEKNESPEQAVTREVTEELGLRADAANFLGHFPFFQKNQLILAYHVAGAGELSMSTELAEVRRVPLDRVDSLPVADPAQLRNRPRASNEVTTDGEYRVLPLALWCWSRHKEG